MIKIKFLDLVFALLLCVIIVLSSVLCAGVLRDSRFYRQSKSVSILISHDSVGIPVLLSDSRVVGLIVRFGGALAAAYIDFELIPLNESGKFVAVLKSLPENIDVDRFEYHGRDLIITGMALSKYGVHLFADALSECDVFGMISSDMYETTDGAFRFSIRCSPPVFS